MPIDFNPCTIFRLKRNEKLAIIIFRVASWHPLPVYMVEYEDGRTGLIYYREIGNVDWDTVLCLPKHITQLAKKQQLMHGNNVYPIKED